MPSVNIFSKYFRQTCRKNPECGKEIPEDKAYCDENCLKRHLEIKKEVRRKQASDPAIEEVLKHMGIEKTNFSKEVAYRHWERFSLSQ